MKQLANFSYAELVFDKAAELVDRQGFDELLAEPADRRPTDVIVLSHGWNNGIDDARSLYAGLAAQLRAVLDGAPPAGLEGRRFALVGVLWPSKKFADQALIPGGAASAQGPVPDAALHAELDRLKGTFDAADADDRLAQAKALVSDLENSPAARDQFVDAVRGVLGDVPADDTDDLPDAYQQRPGREVLDVLKAPVLERGRRPRGEGGATSAAAGRRRGTGDADGGAAWSLSVSGFKAAGQRFLNLTTYYQMKQRAGLVGGSGLNPRLRELREHDPNVRLHLVGHSFGGRLVTAATVGAPGEPALEPDTVTLLQAAFSHYGFAQGYDPGKDGFFRRMLSDHMTRGPVVVTHSAHDTAVGYAYPLATRLGGFEAAGLGDANDRYGGIGRNGAQKTPEATAGVLQAAGTPYAFSPQRVHNLNADAVIDGHSDIQGPEVAYAVLSAIGA